MLGLLATGIGCQHMNYAERGTLFGAGTGGLLGGIIGHQSGHTGAGAVIGSLAGGLAGAAIGDAQDARDERDAALAAYYSRQAQQPRAPALTNADLMKMSQSGLSDEVIINSVKNQGGQFDLGADSLIALKQAGVSDRVIVAIQQSGAPPKTVVPASATVIEAPPRVVVVPPVARVGVVVGPRPYYHRHWRRGWRNHW